MSKKLLGGLLMTVGLGAVAQENDIFLADPTIFPDKGVYYMYGTEAKPQLGFPVLVSKDLKEWKVPEAAMENRYALLKGTHTFGTWGYWAPQVFRHDGRYYMIYTSEENIAVAESDSPAGPFTQRIVKKLDADTKQIDPFLFFDDDGRVYLYHVRLNKGNTIWVAEFEKDFSGIKSETLKQCITATEPWEDTKKLQGPPIIEGPTVIKHKGLYYLFYSANDFRSEDYAVGYATSGSPFGPWKKSKNSPIIDRSLVQMNGTGHGDIFRDDQGELNYVFHTHNSDTTIEERRTWIAGLEFVAGETPEADEVKVVPGTVFKPVLKK